MSICNEKKYANDVLRHGFISEVLPRLLGISGYVQIPTVKIKRNLPQLWYIYQCTPFPVKETIRGTIIV